jgi:hypothetical protein
LEVSLPITVISIAGGSLFAGSHDPHFGISMPPGPPAISKDFAAVPTSSLLKNSYRIEMKEEKESERDPSRIFYARRCAHSESNLRPRFSGNGFSANC